MATWVVHFRIAGYFIDKIKKLNPSEFVAGNVAPDCGYGKKDSKGDFTPPPTITHWSPTGMKKDCRYKDFYNEYLKGKKKWTDSYSFYLGYYVHLLTDIMWSITVYHPTHRVYEKQYKSDPDFDSQMRKDWNDLDFKFMRENPEFIPYKILDQKKMISDYLPYYEPNQLTIQSRFIVDFYKKHRNHDELYRKYKYLTEDDVNNFIECAQELIERDLYNKNLL